MINFDSIDIYVAEGTCGNYVVFDAYPSSSDIRNCCDDLEYPVTVHEVTCVPTVASELFQVNDPIASVSQVETDPPEGWEDIEEEILEGATT